MGLTIHYSLRSRKRSQARVREQIELLHKYAQRLDLNYVGPIESIDGTATDFEQVPESQDEKRWFLIQSRQYVTDPLDRRRSYVVAPLEVIGFSTHPAEGCEAANFGLARYPKFLEVDDRRMPTRLSGWQWSSFCKTQYASIAGPKNFLKAHLSVTAMLDEANRIGVLKSVKDEGDYWEHRDAKSLVESVCEWNELIAGQVGNLKDILPDTMEMESPIKNHPDFEKLEARGRRNEIHD